MLYRAGTNWSIVATTKKVEASEGRIAADAIEVKIDPRAEWTQIFNEAWRINRDYFYAPNMHGVDWNGARDKYAALLPHVATRADLNRAPAVDVERAVGRPSQRRRRRQPDRAEDRSRRAARRGLRRRERPLPVQEGVRRAQLEPAAARAAHRAGRQREGGRVSAGGRRQGPAAADERLQPVREHVGQDRRDHRRAERRTDRSRGWCRWCRSRTRRRCATGTGSRATCARSTPRPAGASPTSTCPTPAGPGTATSSATSTRRPTRTR